MSHRKEDKYIESPFGKQTLLTRIDRKEMPIPRWTVPDVRTNGSYSWDNIRKTDVSMDDEELDGWMAELQTYWGSHRDILYYFRGGIMGMPQTARIIGFLPGKYLDNQGNQTGRFLRLFLECDPKLLAELDPPPQPA